MSSYSSPRQTHIHLSAAEIRSCADRFSARFLPIGLPSERQMVKAFILNYVAQHGYLPTGVHRLSVSNGSFGYLGRLVDFSQLRVSG